ncbi:hypothetical protein GKZ68_02115 [Hymenobacter sp. BRD128]|uniref:PQ-loop domain-containing transporter n=1 Tax=Hymenobacter sp. BRD128 TaxID=2675878 RepID=UPI0015636A29|nr:PQ-loop domain-containing transporter [Hymenobacter sp. BRD128]QKG55538.1 hypothetical protein GKZ68_02115 [Hymenobacter sp. BRD128]
MPLFSIVGGLAAFLTTAAYVPQAYKTIRPRATAALAGIILVLKLTAKPTAENIAE